MKPEIDEHHLIVPQKDIYYISWIIDAAEGIGFLRTDDAKAGKITIFTPKELTCDLNSLIDALRAEGLEITEDTEYGSNEETNETGEIE